MPSYPITVPAGCPSYVSNSVQARCDQALGQGLGSVHSPLACVEAQYRQHIEEEVHMLRRAVDGEKPNGVPVAEDWWLRWGMRTVAKAWSDSAQLAAFREALTSPDYSHMTTGHPVSPDSYHVYRRDPSSPTGCQHVASAGHDLPGVEEVLQASGRSSCQGAQRGEMAIRRAMRGA